MDIRLATRDDIDLLVQVRRDFNNELHPDAVEDHARFNGQFRAYLSSRIDSGQFSAVLGLVDDGQGRPELVSAAFLLEEDCPPDCSLPQGKLGKLINVYTYPPYRRQGYARQVLDALLAQARRWGFDAVELEATEMGRGVYDQIGFEPREYTLMRLTF